MEYTCTNDDTISTGINIETVNVSKLNPHDMLSDSESIHLNKCIDTGMLFNPTSMKANIANNVVIITEPHVIICDPFTPNFLPNKPDAIDPNIGKTIMAKYIIYILLQYFLLIYKMLLEYLNLWQTLLLLLLLYI